MPVSDLFEPLTLLRGPAMKNRFMLAPLTNKQSDDDGTASDEEIAWLTQCARGGFALVQTCGASIDAAGKTFNGQLGIYSDRHLESLTRLASSIRESGSLSSVQIHHGGPRSSESLGGKPVGPSDDRGKGVRGLSTAEVETLRDNFISAARRAEQAGFDGIEVHSAFGFVPSLFLSPVFNRRIDRYGGSLEGRTRLLFEVIDGIRRTCGADFQIGLRLSVERHGLQLDEMRDVAAEVFRVAAVDYLDLALWDALKEVVEEGKFKGRSMLDLFTDLPRNGVRLGAAGKLMGAEKTAQIMEAGCDFVLIGRGAILAPDFPNRVLQSHDYRSPSLPVSRDYLRNIGLSEPFVAYMSTWSGFVA